MAEVFRIHRVTDNASQSELSAVSMQAARGIKSGFTDPPLGVAACNETEKTFYSFSRLAGAG